MDRWLVIPIVPDELCVPSFQRTLQHLNAVHWAAPIASEGRRAVMPCCSAGAVLGWTSTSLSNGLRAARIMLERLVHLSIPQVRSSRLGQHSLTGQQQLRGKLNEFPRTQVFSSKVVPRSLKPSPKGCRRPARRDRRAGGVVGGGGALSAPARSHRHREDGD